VASTLTRPVTTSPPAPRSRRGRRTGRRPC
jgi:hypothetical protein